MEVGGIPICTHFVKPRFESSNGTHVQTFMEDEFKGVVMTVHPRMIGVRAGAKDLKRKSERAAEFFGARFHREWSIADFRRHSNDCTDRNMTLIEGAEYRLVQRRMHWTTHS
jgi:hypothetical protein